MRLRYDDATEAFRVELNRWLDGHVPPPEEQTPAPRSSADMPPWVRAWQRTLFDHGWLVPGYPPELGGRDATPVQTMVYYEEMAKRPVRRTYNPQGLSIITPSILDVGTSAQRERFALPSLRGEIAWCLGMSEPGAGSDLASLSTRAVLDGDRFVVDGQKVWTSGAQHADWCFCFVRTDPTVPKHKGISVLLIDMRSEGIRVRPLPDVLGRGHADFNEVFFTGVEVPADQLVGELGQGWAIANGSLAHERGMMWLQGALTLHADVERAVVAATAVRAGGRRLADDPVVRDRVAAAAIDSQAMLCLGYQGFAKFARGMQSPEHSVLKLFGSEASQRLRDEMGSFLGAEGVVAEVVGPGGHSAELPWVQSWLQMFGQTISAGASEIQRNIVAERVLGLPRR